MYCRVAVFSSYLHMRLEFSLNAVFLSPLLRSIYICISTSTCLLLAEERNKRLSIRASRLLPALWSPTA